MCRCTVVPSTAGNSDPSTSLAGGTSSNPYNLGEDLSLTRFLLIPVVIFCPLIYLTVDSVVYSAGLFFVLAVLGTVFDPLYDRYIYSLIRTY